MSLSRWFPGWRARLRAFFGRGRLEREPDSELRFHLDQQIAEHVERGLPPEEPSRSRTSTVRYLLISGRDDVVWPSTYMAEQAELPVAGHVPRGVTVEDALVSGIRSIEHVAELGDLVEAEDSPFRDGWHWSRLYLGMPVASDKVTDAAARLADPGVCLVPTMA